MNCKCGFLADFRCSCGIVICINHLDAHKAFNKLHEIEDLETIEIKTELEIRIHSIKSFKEKIITIIENSTIQFGDFADQALYQLNILEKKHINLMKIISLEGLKNIELRELLSTTLVFRPIEFNNMQNLSEVFSELYYYKIRPINERTLFQKAQKLRRIMKNQLYYFNEIKFSDDLQYAFKCNN